MEFWMLTEKGKRFIFPMEESHVENEARVLEFLNRVGSATIEVIAHGIKRIKVCPSREYIGKSLY